MRLIATIGVYGWTLDAWLAALGATDVRLVLDVGSGEGFVVADRLAAEFGLRVTHLRPS